MQDDIIITGAGPAGLLAAYNLTKSGRKVLILEARSRTGGRAHTIYNDAGESMETGAEFIHGKLPITLGLLKTAKLSYTETGGRWIQVKGGKISEALEGKDWPLFMSKLKALKEDLSLQDFLEKYFPEPEYAALKDRALGYAEGYDSADASRASARALYQEWSSEDHESYRIDEGYTGLMDFLVAACEKAGCQILLSHVVSDVRLAENGVIIIANGETFRAGKALIALPLGVLQAPDTVRFDVSSNAHNDALQQLGIGDVIKFVFRFKENFWEDEYPHLGFLMSGATVPTWWTQAPEESNVLTGWMAGRNARAHAHLSSEQLLDIALLSLAQIFSMEQAVLESWLEETCIANWSKSAYTRGSYAYATVGYKAAQEVLRQPVSDRIFFAGEYMYDGSAMGTVEAAFWSGQDTARRILEMADDL